MKQSKNKSPEVGRRYAVRCFTTTLCARLLTFGFPNESMKTIELRNYGGQSHYTNEPVAKLGTIKRQLYAEQCGNFEPIFCRYNRAWYLVHSDAGDTSDPFRREESYAQSFFICSEQPCERKTVSGHTA